MWKSCALRLDHVVSGVSWVLPSLCMFSVVFLWPPGTWHFSNLSSSFLLMLMSLLPVLAFSNTLSCVSYFGEDAVYSPTSFLELCHATVCKVIYPVCTLGPTGPCSWLVLSFSVTCYYPWVQPFPAPDRIFQYLPHFCKSIFPLLFLAVFCCTLGYRFIFGRHHMHILIATGLDSHLDPALLFPGVGQWVMDFRWNLSFLLC